jgi:hypothetical protein
MKADIVSAITHIAEATQLYQIITTCEPNNPALPATARIHARTIMQAYEQLGDLTSCDQFYQLSDDWDPDNRELEEAV